VFHFEYRARMVRHRVRAKVRLPTPPPTRTCVLAEGCCYAHDGFVAEDAHGGAKSGPTRRNDCGGIFEVPTRAAFENIHTLSAYRGNKND